MNKLVNLNFRQIHMVILVRLVQHTDHRNNPSLNNHFAQAKILFLAIIQSEIKQ